MSQCLTMAMKCFCRRSGEPLCPDFQLHPTACPKSAPPVLRGPPNISATSFKMTVLSDSCYRVKPHITVSKFQVGYTKSPIGGSGPCQCGYSAPRQIQTAIFDEHTRQYSCGSAHLNMWSLPIHTCHFGCSGHHYRLPDCPTNVREGLSGCTPLMAYGETGAGTEVYRAEGSEAQKLRGFVL